MSTLAFHRLSLCHLWLRLWTALLSSSRMLPEFKLIFTTGFLRDNFCDHLIQTINQLLDVCVCDPLINIE